MKQLTQEQAIAFSNSCAWQQMTDTERALLQINQDRLCMPFDVFQESVENTVGRPVWTHEFGIREAVEQLRIEIESKAGPSMMEHIIGLLPSNKE